MKIKIAVVILALIIFTITYNLPKIKAFDSQLSKIIYHEQSFYGDIKIIDLNPYHCLLVNAQTQSCANKEKTTDEVYIQLFKELMAEIHPKDILLVGLGGGSLLSVAPNEANVDVVEIDLKLASAATDYGFMPERNFNLYIDDARSFIKHAVDGQYDVIIVDALLGDSLPYYLFSQESLMQMSRVLTPRGSLLINTAAELAVDDRFSQALVGTIKNIFPRVEIITGNENYTPRPIIVAVKEDDSINFTDFKTIVWPKQDVEQFILITDEFNPLETYYLKHSLELHQNNSALGQEIFFSK